MLGVECFEILMSVLRQIELFPEDRSMTHKNIQESILEDIMGESFAFHHMK